MAAIDNAIRHFQEKQKVSHVDVPEWGDKEPLRIYVKPITLKQKQEILKLFRNKGEGQALAHLIHLKALDADGNRLFAGEQLTLFTKADPEVVERVAMQIWNLGLGKDPDADPEDEDFGDNALEALKKS